MRIPLAVLMAVLCLAALPAGALAQDGNEVFTYVALWKIDREAASAYWDHFDKHSKPVLDKMVDDGTLLEWARTASVVHTRDGQTHSAWWVSDTFAGTQKVLDALMRLPPIPGYNKAIKEHWDEFLISDEYHWNGGGKKPRYIHLGMRQARPGHGSELTELWEKYNKPVLEKLLANGTILGYGRDREYIHTAEPGLFTEWYLTENAEAIDQVRATIRAEREKWTVEARRAVGAAFGEAGMREGHRDGLAVVLDFKHK